MRFFRRRKVEQIDLPENEKQVEELPFNLFNDEVIEEAKISKEEIISSYKHYQDNKANIMRKYYFVKIYAYTTLKGSETNLLALASDRHLSNLVDLEKHFEYNYNKLDLSDVSPSALHDLSIKLQELQLSYDSLFNILDDVEKTLYKKLKIATINVALNRPIEDLKTLYDSLKDFLKTYHSLEEAAQDIYYNSGELIQNLITQIVNRFANFANKRYITNYPFAYFLKSDAVITLSLGEWIDLYNKLRFVLKSSAEVNLLNLTNLRKNYQDFELRYLILLMNSEI